MSVLFCTLADLLLALSQDAQAQLSNDPLRRWPLGTANGVLTNFLTPFLQATTLLVYNNGVAVTTGWALSSGTGTDGADEVVFTVAPVSGAISASGDKRALNLTVLDAARLASSRTITRYLPLGTDVTNPWLLEQLQPIAVNLAKAQLRGRRELGMSDTLDMLIKADLEWLRGVRDGKGLPVLPDATTIAEDAIVRVGSEPSIFGAPGENDDTEDDLFA
ncbi:MAG: hypothetical protein Q8P41_31605 [Pseudomonadota bacterium]|nr:hypothetical protein [Pseudomonadota bacterium]